MKKINLRESLLKIDRSTDFKHALTDLYEACMLEDSDKKRLAQFIEDKDIPGMSKLLTNASGIMTENAGDDLTDEELMEAGWRPNLTDCPECGDISFDSKRGKCTKCFYTESLTENTSEDYVTRYQMEYYPEDDDEYKLVKYIYADSTEDAKRILSSKVGSHTLIAAIPESVPERYKKWDVEEGLVESSDGDCTYHVASYYDEKRRALEDDLTTSDISEAMDFAWRCASSGGHVIVTNNATGKECVVSQDDVIDDVSEYLNDCFNSLNEGIFSIAGDAVDRGLGDLYKGVKNVARGVRDVTKAGANDIKKAATDVKQSKFADKVRDASRAIKNSDSVDDFKADYKRRQDLRKKSDAKRDQVWTDKQGNARTGKSIGNEQDWTYVVNGKKMKYDDYMKIPSNERQKLNNAGKVKRLDLSGRPITKNQNDKRLNASWIRESILNEGPGAGYEISCNITIDSFDGTPTIKRIEIDKDPGAFANSYKVYLSCNGTGHADGLEAYSYYYGDSFNGTYPVKISELLMSVSVVGEGDLREVVNNSLNDILSDLIGFTFTSKYVYGGGWSHSTYDGTLTDTTNPLNDTYWGEDDNISYEVYGMDARLTDSDIIEDIDIAVTGENEYDDFEESLNESDSIISDGFSSLEAKVQSLLDKYGFTDDRYQNTITSRGVPGGAIVTVSFADGITASDYKIIRSRVMEAFGNSVYTYLGKRHLNYSKDNELWSYIDIEFPSEYFDRFNKRKTNESKFVKESYTHFTYKSGANPYIAKTDAEVNKLLKKYGNKVKKVKDGYYEIDDSDDGDLFAVDKSLTERVGPTHPEESKIADRLMSIPGTTKVEFDWSNAEIYRVPENHLIMLVFCRDGFDEPYFENRRKWRASVLGKLRTMGWTLEDPVEDNDSYLYLVMQKRRAVTENADSPKSGLTKYKVTWKIINADDSYVKESKEVFAKDEKSATATVKDKRARDIKAVKMTEAFKHPQFEGPWWYLCKHGIGPGALPKDVTVLETVEDETNPYRVYVALDKVLTTSELRQYEMKEARPPQKMTESNSFRNHEGKVDASKWYASKYPTDKVGIEQLRGLYMDDLLKDRSSLGRCDTQVRDRVYAQLDNYSKIELSESTTNSSKLIRNAITELVKSGSSISDPDFVDDVMDYMEDAFGEHPPYREVLNAIRDFRSRDRANTLKSIDTSNRNTFQVGDEMTYSGLYGGETTIKVLGVNGSRMKAEISWSSMEDGSDLKDKKVFDIVLDDEGNDCIEVWHYRGETGRVYPPKRDNGLEESFSTGDRVKQKFANPYNVGKIIGKKKTSKDGEMVRVKWDYSDGDDVEWVNVGDVSPYNEDDEKAGYYESLFRLREDTSSDFTPDENGFIKFELVPDNRKWQYSVGGKDVPYTSYEDAVAHIKDDYNICDYRQELQQYLKSNGFDYFVDETFDGRLCIEIHWGDWRHEHQRADYLVRQFFMDKGLGVHVDEQVTEDDGSDCYSADHYYEIDDLYFSGRVVD